jgi:hypothetical protein
MRRIGPLLIAALALSLPATAGASALPDGVRALPTVKRTIVAKKAAPRHCFGSIATGKRGVATTVYRAKMSGFATVRLAGRRGDWDLALFDKRTRRPVASSAGYRAREVAQTWIGAGDKLLVQGCRRKSRARRARVGITLFDIAPPEYTGAPMMLSVPYKNDADLKALENLGADVTHSMQGGRADVIVGNARHAEILRDAGFDFDVEISNLTRNYRRARAADAAYGARVKSSSLPTGRTSYRVYDDYQTEMKEIVASHSDFAKPVVLPERTFQGREIQGIEFGTGASDDGKPVFLLVALHHAREWPSAEAAMEFAHMVADGYGSDQRITDLLDRTHLVVVPLINADGFVSTRGFVDAADLITGNGDGNPTGQGINPDLGDPDGDGQDCLPVLGCGFTLATAEAISPPGGFGAYRRKNCDGDVPSPNVPCELQWGVDPNRNYGYNWGGPGSSGERFSQSYRGTGPWSEPETQAVHEFSQRRQITNVMTLHNVAALVLRPPGVSTDGLAPDEAALKQIGDAMGDATGYTSQYGYQLYDTSGTTEDWNYAQQGAFGYTIEMGPEGGEFHMPYETGVVNEWDGTAAGNGLGMREALMIAWQAAADPTYHSVIEGTAPAGMTLRLKKDFVTVTKPTCKSEVGIAPLNSEAVYDIWSGFAGQPFPCPEHQDPIEVPDGLETTMTVPASGSFRWHVNPSTRPFVGQPRQVDGTKLQEYVVAEGSGTPGDPPPTADLHESNTDTEFQVDTSDGADTLELELGYPQAGEDYDLWLYKKAADGTLTPIGTGLSDGEGESRSTSNPERIVVSDLQSGTYVARVENYAGVTNNWTLTAREFAPGALQPGTTESWKLTCENAQGTVLESRDVIVDRGQRITTNLACGQTTGGKPGKKPKPPKPPKR